MAINPTSRVSRLVAKLRVTAARSPRSENLPTTAQMDVRNRLSNVFPPQADRRSSIPCQFFAQSRCRNGSSCTFSHAANQGTAGIDENMGGPSRISDMTLPSDSRSHIACRFFIKGSCLKNEKCPFAHDTSRNIADTTLEAEEGSVPEDWCRDLQGAMVHFGDGAVVMKVNFPSDFSAVRISNLPEGTTADSVVTFLASYGFTASKDCIRLSIQADSTQYHADVRVEDPRFSKRLCQLLAMQGHGSPTATPINIRLPQTSDYRRVDSKKVNCSWHKPTKTAWLNFGNGSIAAKVGSRFSDGTYKVLNQIIQCEGPTRGAGNKNPLAWTIRLSEVPMHAEKWDVTEAIPAAMGPRHVELSKTTYEMHLPSANTLIESLLLKAGPLERFVGSLDAPGKRFKAKAWFMSDSGAMQAVKLLHNKPLPFYKNGKLTVQLVHSARLKVLARVYDVVEQELADRNKIWASQHLLFTAYPSVRHLRVLKIEGTDSGDVAGAKATLENIISGELMRNNGKAIWASSFAANGHTYQQMKQLEREFSVIIFRDKRRERLRLIGPQARHEEVRLAIMKLANAHSTSTYVIELDTQQFSSAFKGGYRAIATAIGEDKVVLDILSTPRRIVVAGSEADFKIAQEILSGREGASRKRPDLGSINDCAICWTEAENPIRTPCNHIYCADCFEDLCFAGVKSEPCIHCQGDAGNCSEIFLLAELQAHLSSAVLEDILELAFKTYVARHANELRHCPTPDCGQIYRAMGPAGTGAGATSSSESIVFKCPVCLTAICTACNASHDGLTCAEYHDHQSGGYKALQAAKEELGIKNCPSCNVMIQKASGCNHMTCSACRAHICWVCLRTFPESEVVYDHMRRKHGGIGIEYFPELTD
ncbi:hypothetical protein QQS21_008878 [Conoideocrella luteorostrata]|uniref:RING-type E3 ubiquitin transferase n=1 Tax=Conoideocrella luteorostrata TaxID=1105319 RepID=A0AAJ0FQZ6_9HYPO|nr:hypothetical protein QQS21_008878 [Conoideocrella luteorostrata]